MNQLQLLGAVEIGLIYSLVAIGVYITFKVIDFPDLTVDGSFTLGAAVSSAMIFAGYNPYIATIVSILSGACAGFVTGYLNVRWNILGLLAGILTMTALYSINLRIMGRPNIAIIDESTVFGSWSIILVILLVTVLTILKLTRFFASEFGLAIRAVGINPKVSSAYGIRVGVMKIVALAISNGIVALAGSLFAQSQGFALVHPERIWVALVTCAIGSILYRIAIAFALNAHDIGLEASDLNLITALLVALTMIATRFRKKSGARSI